MNNERLRQNVIATDPIDNQSPLFGNFFPTKIIMINDKRGSNKIAIP